MAKLKTRTATEVARFINDTQTVAKHVEVVIRSDGAVLRKYTFQTWSDTWKRWPEAQAVLKSRGRDELEARLTSRLGYRKA